MAKKLTKAHMAITLATIVEAGEEGMFAPPELAKELFEKGFVEVNHDAVDEYDCLATRATPAGIAVVAAEQAEAGDTPVDEAVSFVIEDGIEMPKGGARRASSSKYPFDKLEVGQSFFVPQTAKTKDIVRTMSSVVSNAKKKYAEEIPGKFKESKNGPVPVLKYTRNFVARPVEGGARVWRTE